MTLAARDGESLNLQREKLSRRGEVAVSIQTVDLRDPASIAGAVTAAGDDLGPIGILVNNAGVAPSAPLAKLQLDSWREAFDVNVQAAFLLSQAVVGGMADLGHGRIVNLASTAGLRGYPFVAAYVASKHALVGLTRALALELAKGPVTVNAVCPGYTETEIALNAIRNIEKSGKTEAEARAIPGTGPMEFTGKPMGGMVAADDEVMADLTGAADFRTCLDDYELADRCAITNGC